LGNGARVPHRRIRSRRTHGGGRRSRSRFAPRSVGAARRFHPYESCLRASSREVRESNLEITRYLSREVEITFDQWQAHLPADSEVRRTIRKALEDEIEAAHRPACVLSSIGVSSSSGTHGAS
jgi:hypothetical protein